MTSLRAAVFFLCALLLNIGPGIAQERPVDLDAPGPLVVRMFGNPQVGVSKRFIRERSMETFLKYHPEPPSIPPAIPVAKVPVPDTPADFRVQLAAIGPFFKGATGNYTSPITVLGCTTTATGVLVATNTASIACTFSANVTVTASPVLNFGNVSPSASALYQSTSGAVVTFLYTVASGQTTSGAALTTASINAITGGSITAASGGAPVNLGGANGLTFSGVSVNATSGSAPYIVSLTTSPANGVLVAGQPLTIYAQWSTAVTVSGGVPTLNLGTSPSTSAATCNHGSGTTYLICTYIVGTNTESPVTTTSAALSLNGATLTGSGGSANTAAANNVTFIGLSFNALAACPGTQYNVSRGGSDASSGIGPLNAWATPAHAQAQTYGPVDCLSFNGNDATFLGYISGNTLTVVDVLSGVLNVNDPLSQQTVLLESWISALGTGSGGTGTYTIGGDAQTVGSAAQPVLMIAGQAFVISSGVQDGIACFSINPSNVPSNSGNFTLNAYGGGHAALLSSSTCAASTISYGWGFSGLADINGVNATVDGINVYANGQNQVNGFILANQRGAAIDHMIIQHSACVGMKTTTSDSNNSFCYWTQVNSNVNTVTLQGITATGENGPASTGDQGIALFHGGGTINQYTVQGFECKNFGGKNTGYSTGSCAGSASTADPNSALMQGFFIHDYSWNVYQCGGESGIELYQVHNFTTQYGEIWNVRPSNWNAGSPQTGCDWDGYDNDGGAASLLQYVFIHDNYGTGVYGWVNDVSGSIWGPFTARFFVAENNGYGLIFSNRVGNVGTGGGAASGCFNMYNGTVINTATNVDSGGNGQPAFQGAGIPGCGLIANMIFGVPADTNGHNNFAYFFSNALPGVSWKNNDYWNRTSGTFRVYQYGSGSQVSTTLSNWESTVGETGGTTANPMFVGTPPFASNCGPGGTGLNQPQGINAYTQGPNPCPTLYGLQAGSPLKGAGYTGLSAPGSFYYDGSTFNPAAPDIGAF